MAAAAGYDFSDGQKLLLQQSVTAFEQWCTVTFGEHTQHKEIPVTYQSDEGTIVSGFIDLLIETDAGYWIIDHKTHKADDPDQEFCEHVQQLQAYKKGIEQQGDNNIVLGLGCIGWLRRWLLLDSDFGVC